DKGVSPAVAQVIQKAISYNPNNRYASAKDMRDALLRTPEEEPPKSKKRINIFYGCAAAVFLFGLVIMGIGLSQTRRTKEMHIDAQDAEKALYAGDYTAALREAGAAVGSGNLLDPPAPADAQKILANVLGIYQFEDGYRPWYSIPTAEYGSPVFARISPNGTRLAVMFRQSGGDGAAVIQMWDTETGRVLQRLETDGVLGSFAFLDNEHLIYATGGQLICESFESGGVSWKTEPRPNRGPVCLALSGAGNKAAVMFENDSTVYRCNTVNSTSGDTIPYEEISLDSSLESLNERLFALNEDGSRLAVSFSGSDLAVYDIEDSRAVRREEMSLQDTQSGFTNFEGGFYDGLNYDGGSQKRVSRFFYAAFMEDETGYVSEYYRHDLDGTDETGEPLGAPRQYETIYARVDRGGMYRTQGSTFFKVPTELEGYGKLGELEQPINLLEHYFTEIQNDGRILLGTASIIQVRGEDGKSILLSIPLSKEDISYDRGCISGNYVALISSKGSRISVLKWMPGEARSFYGYPVLQENKAVRRTVRSDRGAVILYDETGYAVCENSSAKSLSWIKYADYGSGGRVLEVQYERHVGGDRIKVIRENGILYCPVQGGEEPEETADENPVAQTFAVRYQSLLENNAIKNTVKNQEILSISTSANSDWTLVSLRGINMEGRSLLLDRTCEIIAEIPVVCDTLADGTLFADNGSGVIAEALIASLEDMRKEAQTREGRLGFA
ncbi:MAG: hypothetical protein IJT94_02135, partial [Oscillibacter sp.]|nr:hypothetical protein [Oscillibacter sp.]